MKAEPNSTLDVCLAWFRVRLAEIQILVEFRILILSRNVSDEESESLYKTICMLA
jgi:hypothetical protein